MTSVNLMKLLFFWENKKNIKNHDHGKSAFSYRTRAIETRSWWLTTLDCKPRILGSKIEEFTLLVHKLSVILTALQYKQQWKMGKYMQAGTYNGTCIVYQGTINVYTQDLK